MLVDSEIERSKQKKSKLARMIVDAFDRFGVETASDHDRSEEQTEEEEDPTVLQEVWQAICREMPLLSVVIVISLLLGHFQAGWGLIKG